MPSKDVQTVRYNHLALEANPVRTPLTASFVLLKLCSYIKLWSIIIFMLKINFLNLVLCERELFFILHKVEGLFSSSATLTQSLVTKHSRSKGDLTFLLTLQPHRDYWKITFSLSNKNE